MSEAFVSLITNDDYARGADVLGKSLKRSGTTLKCVLMVTDHVSSHVRDGLKQYWDEIIDVNLLESGDEEKLAILARPELGCTFTKLRAWTLKQYEKCVFLDADTMVLQNVDDLFEREELSAAPDVGWPDCFNTGVFVFKPNVDTYHKLLEFAKKMGSFDGGDQGLLNDFFSDWSASDSTRRLPFVYNMVANITYSYTPAFMRYGQGVKIVHFLGAIKPWHHHYDDKTGKVRNIATPSVSDDIFAQMWWDMYKIGGGASSKPSSSPNSWRNWEEARAVYADRRQQWEQGVPDYQGEDRFDNILTHMKAMMVATAPIETVQNKPADVQKTEPNTTDEQT